MKPTFIMATRYGFSFIGWTFLGLLCRPEQFVTFANGMSQEMKQGKLFANRSQWHDFKLAMKQIYSALAKTLSLWKTSIQTVEAKHGDKHHILQF